MGIIVKPRVHIRYWHVMLHIDSYNLPNNQ